MHCYDYVNQPFEIVRRAVLADPQGLFRAATSSTDRSRLHVRLGGVDLQSEIEIELGGVTENRDSFTRPSTTIALSWRGRRSPGWFPVMNAKLEIFPLSPTETQVTLSGTYKPPLGALGDTIDAAALHKLAQTSVDSFVREVATYLRRTLPARQAMA